MCQVFVTTCTRWTSQAASRSAMTPCASSARDSSASRTSTCSTATSSPGNSTLDPDLEEVVPLSRVVATQGGDRWDSQPLGFGATTIS